MRYSDEFLYNLRQNNPIEEVMSSYVPLKKQGRNYACVCPFHADKNPSCVVYTDTSSYYCFGCHAGGDVITFIKEIENMEFDEAVKLLADRAGMVLPERNGEDASKAYKKARILEINREAANFYYLMLSKKEGIKGVMYFKQREIKPETVKKYGLGYAPDSWSALRDYMNSKGFSDNELIEARLCQRSEKGGVYDIFRDRAIFPILDVSRNVIAFGGRIIDGSGPKYLNSPETYVFNKSKNLFSFNFAKKSKPEYIILAEGYMDVIALNQAGFENTVATLGTALTPEQATLIARNTSKKEVVIAYDSDGAGRAAAHRAIKIFADADPDVTVRILDMQGAKDPDEYIKKFGEIRFKMLIENSQDAIHFELEKCKENLDLEKEADRAKYLKKAIYVLSEIPSPVDREVYISKVSEEQNISKDVIVSQTEKLIASRKKSEKALKWSGITARTINRFSSDDINPDAKKYPRENKAECGILAYLFENPERFRDVYEKIKPENFVTSFNKKVYSVFAERIQNTEYFTLSSLADEFSGAEMGKISEIMAKSQDITINENALNDFIKVILSHTESVSEVGDLTDDDFLTMVEKMKNNK